MVIFEVLEFEVLLPGVCPAGGTHGIRRSVPMNRKNWR